MSQEGEDLFLSTLTVSRVQSLEYSLSFTFCMCRVHNTELLLEREPGGGGSVPEHAHRVPGAEFGIFAILYPLQSMEY
jgi:hypothetical protein